MVPAEGAAAVGDPVAVLRDVCGFYGVALRSHAVPAGGAWILDEPTGEHDVGQLIILPVHAPRLMNKAMGLLAGRPTLFVQTVEGREFR